MAATKGKRDVVKEAKSLLKEVTKLADENSKAFVFWGAFALIVNFFLGLLLELIPPSPEVQKWAGAVGLTLNFLAFMIGYFALHAKSKEYTSARNELTNLIDCYEYGSNDFEGLSEEDARKLFTNKFLELKRNHANKISSIILDSASDGLSTLNINKNA